MLGEAPASRPRDRKKNVPMPIAAGNKVLSEKAAGLIGRTAVARLHLFARPRGEKRSSQNHTAARSQSHIAPIPYTCAIDGETPFCATYVVGAMPSHDERTCAIPGQLHGSAPKSAATSGASSGAVRPGKPRCRAMPHCCTSHRSRAPEPCGSTSSRRSVTSTTVIHSSLTYHRASTSHGNRDALIL